MARKTQASRGGKAEGEPSDADLMKRIQEGDTKALDILYGRWSRPILHFFYHMGVERTRAEDGMQEVFLRLLKSAKNYRPIGKFSTYLFQIAKNYWFNEQGKIRRAAKPFSGLSSPKGDSSSTGPIQFPDSTAGPRTRAMKEEMDFRVRDAVQGLSEPLRVVFVLSAYEGMKYEQIGEILEIPVGTVKSRMSKAMEALEGRLRKYT